MKRFIDISVILIPVVIREPVQWFPVSPVLHRSDPGAHRSSPVLHRTDPGAHRSCSAPPPVLNRWQNGLIIYLYFSSAITLKNNTRKLNPSGGKLDAVHRPGTGAPQVDRGTGAPGRPRYRSSPVGPGTGAPRSVAVPELSERSPRDAGSRARAGRRSPEPHGVARTRARDALPAPFPGSGTSPSVPVPAPRFRYRGSLSDGSAPLCSARRATETQLTRRYAAGRGGSAGGNGGPAADWWYWAAPSRTSSRLVVLGSSQ